MNWKFLKNSIIDKFFTFSHFVPSKFPVEKRKSETICCNTSRRANNQNLIRNLLENENIDNINSSLHGIKRIYRNSGNNLSISDNHSTSMVNTRPYVKIDKYLLNLQDILNFAEIVNNAPVEGLQESIGVNENYNVFRKDEIKEFDNIEGMLKNAPEEERNMFKIPKVIQ